ncbi:MAG: hydratase [Clostridiales bacterium]|jgi:aconitate hydratase|nr:hydratase [Clostridiales bacterium]
MVKPYNSGAYLPQNGEPVLDNGQAKTGIDKAEAKRRTIAHQILSSHNVSCDTENLKIKFDALTSHDITYVGIVQTARASGLKEFPLPYVLTNCHNSLCAVGGTINEDDHMFGLSAARKYGGIYVPAHLAVLHQYMREMMAGCGKMILGSDSHTRYGALGTMAIGEGGPELVKQLLGRTYDIEAPDVVAVYLTGKPVPGVGPQDVALALIGAVFKTGFVKNKALEFVGPGIKNLSADFRMGIDVMTTETACLSSVWATDSVIKDFYAAHGRPEDYKELVPGDMAYYDGLITIDLSQVKPMIALPFHPSNAFEIETLNANLEDILAEAEKAGQGQLESLENPLRLRDKIKDGRLFVQQGVIAGCAGGSFENILAAADIIGGNGLGNSEFSLSIYPASQPVNLALTKGGQIASLISAGAVIRTAFCGPCFGAGDVPANNSLSIRHTTRNFPYREGSKPGSGQIASVALMDARSIAATARNGGRLTPATDFDTRYSDSKYSFDDRVYRNRCYYGYKSPIKGEELRMGPGITDWPEIKPLEENALIKVITVIDDPVTTTDELIPSGEASSYRSNPMTLAEFTLSRKDPSYVAKAKAVKELELLRQKGGSPFEGEPRMARMPMQNTGIGSAVFAVKPGDGSAREQAASSQRVLGASANFANEYATKRYRSNLINWGILPFIVYGSPFEPGDYVYVPEIRRAIEEKRENIAAVIIRDNLAIDINLTLGTLTDDEREIILKGCLINYYRSSEN